MAPESAANMSRFPSLRNVRLLARMPDASTIDLLKGLLREAEAGNLAGLVAVPLYPRGHAKRYDLGLSGFAAENPTYAAGVVDVCHMLLREAALQDSGLT